MKKVFIFGDFVVGVGWAKELIYFSVEINGKEGMGEIVYKNQFHSKAAFDNLTPEDVAKRVKSVWGVELNPNQCEILEF